MKLSFRLEKSADIIFDYLTDMQKFVSVHLVIYKIDNTGINRYLVYEMLKFGFIPFPFTYPVAMKRIMLSKLLSFVQ